MSAEDVVVAGTEGKEEAEEHVSSAFSDKTLVCKDCGQEWVFSAGEQEFYAEKQLENEPARCKDCRKVKKNARYAARKQRYASKGDRGDRPPRAEGEGKPARSNVCYRFQKGECTLGDQCRFEHVAAADT